MQVLAEDCGTEDSVPMELEGLRAAVASFKDRIRGRVLGKPIHHPDPAPGEDEVLFEAGYLG